MVCVVENWQWFAGRRHGCGYDIEPQFITISDVWFIHMVETRCGLAYSFNKHARQHDANWIIA